MLTQQSDFRDYLYISVRKVIRMSRTLRTPIWKHIRDFQLKLGPVGAALTLDLDSRAADVIALVPEVERAIEDKFGITYVTDPELKIGQWFAITETPMFYGTPGKNTGGVLFAGERPRRFILGGSSEYLLDRGIPDITEGNIWSYAPSSLAGIRYMSQALAAYDNANNAPEDLQQFNNQIYLLDLRRNHISEIFGGVPQPLSAVAKCLAIDVNAHDNETTIIGTPLYVAFQAPE
jgi:hypothetical protein